MTATKPEVRIVIGPDRHVWVGYFSVDGEQVVIEHAWNIRYWPKGGLGAMCKGPKKEANLDPVGTVRIHWHRVLTYDCDSAAWEDFLAKR